MNLEILLYLGILLFSAKILGEISQRLKMSSMIGEIAAGIILGPIAGIVHVSADLAEFAIFGILFMMFLVGLSIRFSDAKEELGKGSVLAFTGMGLSLLTGVVAGLLINNIAVGLVIGVSIISTSTYIAFRSLKDMGEFKDKLGKVVLSVGMMDQLASIFILSLMSLWISSVYDMPAIAMISGGVFVLMAFLLLAGSGIFFKAFSGLKRLNDAEVLIIIPLVLVFMLSFISEYMHIAAAVGAFLAGLAVSQTPFTESIIMPKIKTIAFGLFVPIFFAYSGVIADLSIFLDPYMLGLIVFIVAGGILAKVIGCGYLGRIFRFSWKDRQILGAVMSQRGEYSIVIAQLAIAAAIIDAKIYTVILSFVLITVIAMPAVLAGLRRIDTAMGRSF